MPTCSRCNRFYEFGQPCGCDDDYDYDDNLNSGFKIKPYIPTYRRNNTLDDDKYKCPVCKRAGCKGNCVVRDVHNPHLP